MSERQERPNEQPRDDAALVSLADRLLQEPEIVAWLNGPTQQPEDEDDPRAA